MDKLIVLGMGIPYPYPTHGHPCLFILYLYNAQGLSWFEIWIVFGFLPLGSWQMAWTLNKSSVNGIKKLKFHIRGTTWNSFSNTFCDALLSSLYTHTHTYIYIYIYCFPWNILKNEGQLNSLYFVLFSEMIPEYREGIIINK